MGWRIRRHRRVGRCTGWCERERRCGRVRWRRCGCDVKNGSSAKWVVVHDAQRRVINEVPDVIFNDANISRTPVVVLGVDINISVNISVDILIVEIIGRDSRASSQVAVEVVVVNDGQPAGVEVDAAAAVDLGSRVVGYSVVVDSDDVNIDAKNIDTTAGVGRVAGDGVIADDGIAVGGKKNTTTSTRSKIIARPGSKVAGNDVIGDGGTT